MEAGGGGVDLETQHVAGPNFVLFGICFWENRFLSSHNVRTDQITMNSQGTAVSVAPAY